MKIPRIGTLLAALAAADEGLAQSAASTPVADVAPGLLQATLGLALVLVLIWGAAWVIRHVAPGLSRQRNSVLKVIARQAVGAREHVVIVEVGGRWLLLGVAAGNVRMLETLAKVDVPEAAAGDHPFARILLRARHGN